MCLAVRQDSSVLNVIQQVNWNTWKFIVEEEQTTLAFDGLSPLNIDYDHMNHLPAATARNL